MASPVHSRQLEGENAHLPGYMHPPHLIIMASKKGTYPTFWIITMVVLKTVLNGNQNYSNLTKPPVKQGGEQNVSSIQFSRSSYLISEVSVCAMYCHLWIFQPSAAQCDKIPAWQKIHSYDRLLADYGCASEVALHLSGRALSCLITL